APVAATVLGAAIDSAIVGAFVYGGRYLLAAGAIVAALYVPGRVGAVTRTLTACGYGVYLSHMCFVRAFNLAERRFSFDSPYAVEVVVVFALSIALTALLLRN